MYEYVPLALPLHSLKAVQDEGGGFIFTNLPDDVTRGSEQKGLCLRCHGNQPTYDCVSLHPPVCLCRGFLGLYNVCVHFKQVIAKQLEVYVHFF